MPLEGHPEDCACCTVRLERAGPSGRKRTREDADLSAFLPEEEGEEEEGEDEEEGEEEDPEALYEQQKEDLLINETLFKSFEAHVERLDAARLRRIETLSFKSALEDDGKEEINEDATQDEIDGLGVWLAGDEFQGDVNYRTLQKLLTRVDQRGFERSAQQLEFHVAFMKAAARVIYRGSWETERPAIMKRYGWETSNSEVLISTPRRFGKTFSCARCPRHSLACALTVPVRLAASPSFARASRSRSVSRSWSSRPRDARPASCSSASLSNAGILNLRGSRIGARAHRPLTGLCDWPAARSASASTTRHVALPTMHSSPVSSDRAVRVRRRRVVSPRSTAASRSSAVSRRKWA